MTARKLAAVAIVGLLLSGCYRTHYRNFAPDVLPQPGERSQGSGWQHFFVFGLFPNRVAIPAATQCGGAEHVKEIETRQTFLQGLVELLSTFYVNIYSPWTGRVVCDGTAPPGPKG
jgi:hypothetical protein